MIPAVFFLLVKAAGGIQENIVADLHTLVISVK